MLALFATKYLSRNIPGDPLAASTLIKDLIPDADIYFVKQVHGADIVIADEAQPGVAAVADGIISRNPKDILGILTADCLPVLARCRDRHIIGAFHAGWRGIAQGIIRQGIQKMMDLGARDIEISLGPAIGPCCFQVQSDCLEALNTPPLRQDAGGYYLDIWRLAAQQALSSGIPPHNIHTLRLCTVCHAALFNSYRRDGAQAGRNISLIGGSSCSLPGLLAV